MTPPEDRYLTAVARRNILWARWQNVAAQWRFADRPTGSLLAAVNEAQEVYEWAERDLVRARVHWRAGVELERLPIAV